MRENVTNTLNYMSNEDLTKKYIKLFYYLIHNWRMKPENYRETFADLTNEILMSLYTIPLYGSRRQSTNYITTTIINTISKYYNKRSKIQRIELEELDYESNKFVVEEKIEEVELEILFKQIIDDVLTIDEKICIIARHNLGYKKKCYLVPKIAGLIFKTEEETELILDSALLKIKECIANNSSHYNNSIRADS